MYGVVSFTRLIPPLLQSSIRFPWQEDQDSALTLSSSVRQLRRAFLYLQQPSSFPLRPPAELKWVAELGLHNHNIREYSAAKLLTRAQMEEIVLEAQHLAPPPAETVVRVISTTPSEWSARWRIISSVRLAGPIRSFLWKLTHRRLCLLNQEWYANHHQRTSSCLLCDQQQPESYSHLFSDCPTHGHQVMGFNKPATATARWGDQRPARLIGDISRFRREWASSEVWRGDCPPPSPEKATRLVRELWTEVRATFSGPFGGLDVTSFTGMS